MSRAKKRATKKPSSPKSSAKKRPRTKRAAAKPVARKRAPKTTPPKRPARKAGAADEGFRLMLMPPQAIAARGGRRSRKGAASDSHVIVLPLQPGSEGESKPQEIVVPKVVPILPIRKTVLFPFAILPLNVGRPKSRQLLSDIMSGDRVLAVFTQKDATQDDPAPGDLHEVGTLANVLRMVRVSDEQISILLQGLARVKLANPVTLDPYLTAQVAPLPEVETQDIETDALAQTVLGTFEKVVALSPSLPNEAVLAARNLSPPARLADFVASLFDLPTDEKQSLLAALDVKDRLKKLNGILARQTQVLEVGAQIQESVRESLDARQKEYVLRQQMEAIQKELGEGDDTQREIKELRERLERSGMPPEVRKEADRELDRLARMPAQAAEHTVSRTYLEWLCDMPWAVGTDDNLDIAHARSVLNEDHFGLDKIKERILEFLAVRRFKKDARTPILCFAGPPGTGKTSLGRSIARALGRKFVRQSLGGVRDEAEIRGHRRTYIGALPGQIIRGLRRAASRNPVFMLDEIDKLTMDFHGDPSSALLEVLDPEQNGTFQDHYLDVPYDLSQVLFICTANILDTIPPALRDRMEIIELAGYTDHEKLEIAKRHLLPKVIRENGLAELGLTITDDAILKVEHDYTSEAGLRNLERELANLLRRTAKMIAEGQEPTRTIDAARVRELLGAEKYLHDTVTRIDRPGQALGLAWTPVGGEVLTIEAQIMPGSKQLVLTGQLGEVMRESAQAALSYVRANAESLGIDPAWFDSADLHLHLPSGAIPKDGPSAGITLCTAIVSLLTQHKMRSGIAMTGEITLLGRVLPIGGLKEKVLAAHRAGLGTVVIPRENEKDLEDVPLDVRSKMIFAPVDRIDQVLDLVIEDFPLGENERREAAERAAAADANAAAGGEPGPPSITTEPVAMRGVRPGS